MTPLGKFMRAEQMGASVSGKTKIWDILARDDFILGTIKWKASWRCYVFEPAAETCFNDTCLTELRTFLSAETSKQRFPKVIYDSAAPLQNKIVAGGGDGPVLLGAEVRRLGLTGEGEGNY